MCTVFRKGHCGNMESWQQILFQLFNYWHAGMGLSLVLHPHLSFLLSLFAFVSQQLSFQVCRAPPCQTTILKKKKGRKVIKGSLCHSQFFQQFYRTTSGLPTSLDVKGPAIVLLVEAAVEMRITQRMMLLGWIFTKGFSHSPAGVFEGDLRRKGRYKTREGCWRKP